MVQSSINDLIILICKIHHVTNDLITLVCKIHQLNKNYSSMASFNMTKSAYVCQAGPESVGYHDPHPQI